MKFIIRLLVVTATTLFLTTPGTGTSIADVWCEQNVGSTGECPEGKRLSPGDAIKALTIGLLGRYINNTGETVMWCHSTGQITVVGSEGAHKGVEALGSLSFSKCEGLCPKVNAHSAPFKLLGVGLTGSLFASKDNFTGLRPGVLFEGCTMFKVNCLYESEVEPILLSIFSDQLSANLALKRSGHSGLCPINMRYEATYLLTLDAIGSDPVYLASLP